MLSDEKMDICKSTRMLASNSLKNALKAVLENDQEISECSFRDKWLSELRKSKEVFQDGWYEPPPHGIGVLFGTEKNCNRLYYDSLRPENIWPKKEIKLDRENGIAYLFASPVDKKSGIIGDFGITIYFGNKGSIIQHLQQCYKTTEEIFKIAAVGMQFCKLYKNAEEIIAIRGLENKITSTTDDATVNIGHAIPASYEDWSNEELNSINYGKWCNACETISKKRKFINSKEEFKIKPGMAITIEPRVVDPKDPGIPLVSYHTIALFYKDGKKTRLTNFDSIFKLVGMEYMF